MDTSITRLSKRLKQCNDPESSAALHAYGEPTLLNLGHKIFLSHSGIDKDFVRSLNKELRRSYHGIEVAFFDEESLPKANPINMEISILEEARNSALGVLVLTDDFFMYTQNPMLELEAFMANKVKLLPLFFKMSVDEFKEEERWNKWEKVWKKWAAKNGKLNIDRWRSYLSIVSTYNGLEFCKIAPCGREDVYIDEVVRQVACIIGPVVPLTGKDVYGKDRLCEIIDDLYEKCSSQRSSLIDCTVAGSASTSYSLGLGENGGFYEYDVVGIHGFPGLGKTTLSKCLCDYYFKEMKGNVCYIDLGLLSETRCSRMWHVLSRLDRRNYKDICNFQLDDNQVEILLGERLSSMQDPVFLAVDNIPPDKKSQQEALIYLRCKFPRGSKIFITSRDEKTLSQLTSLICRSCSFRSVIEYMPKLIDEEAREIFKHGIPDLHNFWHSNPSVVEENTQRDVDACVHMCTIFNGKRYHPLMLKSLAAFVSWDRSGSNLDWKRRLAKLASQGIFDKDNAWEEVYELFDIIYNLLTKKEKEVFLDLALGYNALFFRYEWIHALHVTYNFKKEFLEKILLRLHSLCFIEKIKEVKMEIHDLMVEFGKYKAGADISDGYLVLEDAALDCLDVSDLPRTVRHVNITRCKFRTLDLREVEGVTVLHLLDNAGLGEADNAGLAEVLLSRTCSKHLRSMIVRVPAGTALRCIVNENFWSSQSPKWIHIEGDFDFCLQPASERSLVLPKARKLTFFGNSRILRHFTLMTSLSSVETIDLTPCVNLELLRVCYMRGLKSIRGPESASHLDGVFIGNLPHLEELATSCSTNGSLCYPIGSCPSLRQVSLKCTTPSTRNAGLFPTPLFLDCPLSPSADSLSQYLADGRTSLFFLSRGSDAGIDFLQSLMGIEADGLGAVRALHFKDAQHIGPLISALFQAQPPRLESLRISCRYGYGSSGCTCDQNPPIFCALPEQENGSPPTFVYRCQQVRDLSSLGQWRSLRELSLCGCTNVEVWPDFAAMTSLRRLDLSYNTSLREWPSGVLLLPSLEYLDLSGCLQLPAKEVLLRTITPTHPWDSTETDPWSLASPLRKCRFACKSLRKDLKDGTRDRCTVAVALGELSVELAAIFDRWSPHSVEEQSMLKAILALIYDVWFREGKQGRVSAGVRADGEKQHITEYLIALLSTESFLSLPFRNCRRVRKWSTFDYMGAVIGALGIYTVLMAGRASSTYSHHAHHLRDITIFLFRHIIGFLMKSNEGFSSDSDYDEESEYSSDCSLDYTNEEGSLESQEVEKLRERTGEALCTLMAGSSDTAEVHDTMSIGKNESNDRSVESDQEVREEVETGLSRMARGVGLEVEEGSPESQELEQLRERAVEALCTLLKAGDLVKVEVDDIIEGMRTLWSGTLKVAFRKQREVLSAASAPRMI